jgi:hypothetical protein
MAFIRAVLIFAKEANSIFPLSGEYPAAMQRGGQTFAPMSPTHCLVLAACLIIALS